MDQIDNISFNLRRIQLGEIANNPLRQQCISVSSMPINQELQMIQVSMLQPEICEPAILAQSPQFYTGSQYEGHHHQHGSFENASGIFGYHDASSIPKEIFVCNVCKKSFGSKQSLEQHVLIHSAKRNFISEVCGEGFHHESKLKRHILTHTGEKSHSCNVCQTRFGRKDALKTHMLTHAGEKPHSCEVCNKRFARKCNLNSHLLTHTGEKRHICEICNAGFDQKRYLQQHRKRHMGKKLHICEVCKKVFSQAVLLRQHWRVHKGFQSHKSEKCHQSTTKNGTPKKVFYSSTGKRLDECMGTVRPKSELFQNAQHRIPSQPSIPTSSALLNLLVNSIE